MSASMMCLALALYWEGRNQPIVGQLAIGNVVLNRVKSKRWPNNVCAVVKQKKGINNTCQFSFYCDGKSDLPKEKTAWKRAKALSDIILNIPMFDFSKNADHYHAKEVTPYWAAKLVHVNTIGNHKFYKY